MSNIEWIIPFIYLIREKGDENLSDELNLPKSTLRKYLYFAVKFGLLERSSGKAYRLTEKGLDALSKYLIKRLSRRRFVLKGVDGCFLIIIRKRYSKAIRIPCDNFDEIRVSNP